MQRHFNFVLTHGFQGAVGQAYIALGRFNTGSTDGFGDVVVGNRAEQATVYTGFLCHGNGLAVQFFFACLGIGQNFGLFGFQFSAALFKLGQIGGSSTLCFALRNQKVAGIAVFYGNQVAQIAQTAHFF